MEMTQFVRLPLIGVVIAAFFGLSACVIPLRGGQDAETQAQATSKSHALDGPLTRCRAVTSDQTNAFEQRRQVWAENRRRFFSQDRSGAVAPDAEQSNKSSASQPKSAR
ncbi:MAG TPA: putative entry exclusion protein TrbK-alt [Bradyrhizobium sp.]|jgi:conjugative transfer region protein TrbK|nr:putative entry exclusion protein TrbK-alt [Bradyrhizobium sp.]